MVCAISALFFKLWCLEDVRSMAILCAGALIADRSAVQHSGLGPLLCSMHCSGVPWLARHFGQFWGRGGFYREIATTPNSNKYRKLKKQENGGMPCHAVVIKYTCSLFIYPYTSLQSALKRLGKETFGLLHTVSFSVLWVLGILLFL